MNLPRAKKQLGQHFLHDEKVIQGITQDDWARECDAIIEIGPGPAVLTKFLSLKEKPYFVIEKDTSFKPYLEKFVKTENIIFTDALDFNWPSFFTKNNLLDKKIWLVSNLPYNVGTVLYTQFMQISQIHYMTLMFQKEVGDKTYQKNDAVQMNGLYFLSQNYFESRKLLSVLPGSFTPPPKVDSVVVSYKRRNTPDIGIDSYKALNTFTRNLFGMKRKQVGRVLKSFLAGEKVESILDENNIDKSRRAETLTYDEVLSLFNSTRKI